MECQHKIKGRDSENERDRREEKRTRETEEKRREEKRREEICNIYNKLLLLGRERKEEREKK